MRRVILDDDLVIETGVHLYHLPARLRLHRNLSVDV